MASSGRSSGSIGLVISDALDMGALDQGPAQVVEIIAMMRAGTDLLLCMPDPGLQERARMAVERGHSRGLIADDTLKTAIARVERLRSSLRTARDAPGASWARLITSSWPNVSPRNRSPWSATTTP